MDGQTLRIGILGASGYTGGVTPWLRRRIVLPDISELASHLDIDASDTSRGI